MKKLLGIILCIAMVVSAITITNVVTPAADVTNGLVVHYDFDEESGTAVTDSVGDADGGWAETDKPANRAYKTGKPNTRVEGSLDGAVKFSDLKDREHIYASADALKDLTDMTIATWFSFDTLRAGQMEFLFSIGTFQDSNVSHENSVIFMITGDGNHIKYELKHGTYSRAVEANRGFFEPDTYNLLAVTQSGNTLSIYVNGFLVAQDTDFQGKISNTFTVEQSPETPMKMDIGGNSVWGANDNLEESLRGTMDDFRIYNRALTQEEIVTLREYYEEASVDDTKVHELLDENAIWEMNMQDNETPGNRATVNADGSFTPKGNDAMYWCIFLPGAYNTTYKDYTLYIKTYAKVNITDNSKPAVGAFFSQNNKYWADTNQKSLGDFIVSTDNGGNWDGDRWVSIVIPIPPYEGRDLTAELGLRSNEAWNTPGTAFYKTAIISTTADPLPEHPANAAYDAINAIEGTFDAPAKANIETMIDALGIKDQNGAAISNLDTFNVMVQILELPATVDIAAGDAAKIRAALDAYDKLSDAHKAEVENYDVLEAAKAAYEALTVKYPLYEEIIATDNAAEYVFDNLAPGVYKIGYYMTINGITKTNDENLVKFAPKVNGDSKTELVGGIDHTYSEVVAGMARYQDTNKIAVVSTVTVPEGYSSIDAAAVLGDGFNGTLDNVVIATKGYNFVNETEYTWIIEENDLSADVTGDSLALLAADGTWTASTEHPTDYPKDERIVTTVNTERNLKEGSSDVYGTYVFTNVAPGVYKIAHYLTIENPTQTNEQIRISPIVEGPNINGRRCWIDWPYTDMTTFVTEEGVTKAVIVSLITVPEGYNRIDAGFWYANFVNAGTAKIDKVAIATSGYDFINDTTYTWMAEKPNKGTFNEDPENKLQVADTAWVASTTKLNLNQAIVAAQAAHDAATEGTAKDKYEAGSKATYLAAINAAKVVLDKAGATQVEINAAVTALAEATTAFEAAKITVDLQAAIDAAQTAYDAATEGTAKDKYEAGSKATYLAAIDAAKAVVAKTDATKAEIDSALAALATATTAFEAAKITVDLQAAIDAAQATHDAAVEGVSQDEYAEGSKATYLAAIEAAKAVVAKTDATKAEIDSALAALAEATTAFEAAKNATDAATKDDLGEAVNAAQAAYDAAKEGTAKGEYAAGAKATYLAAIEAANAILNKEGATLQEIQDAMAALSAAGATFEAAKVAEDPKNPNEGKAETGDVAIPFATVALIGMSVAGFVVSKKRKITE